jgi:peptide/nickel transport system ATP-binding protein
MFSVCIDVENVSYSYQSGIVRRKRHDIFKNVSFSLVRGKTIGIIGKSGAGKTTLGKIIAGIIKPTDGRILYRNSDIAHMDRRSRYRFRRNVQMLFQDPEGALNPMKSIEQQFFEVCKLTATKKKEEASRRTHMVLEQVGLSDEILCRLPSQLSGGQNQRVALGKLLLINPAVIILDEPTSALDISVQASILHLLRDIQRRYSLSYVFISHDMEVIQFMCDEVVSMDQIKDI